MNEYLCVHPCFTIQLKGEIGRQHVKAPMAAIISPFMISAKLDYQPFYAPAYDKPDGG